MKQKKVFGIIFLSLLALIVLVVFQTRWIATAHQLRKAQFDQQVSMALCHAIDNFSQDPGICKSFKSCASNNPEAISGLISKSTPTFDSVLSQSLTRYNIGLDFQFQVSSTQNVFNYSNSLQKQAMKDGPYQCNLSPLAGGENLDIEVFFPEKDAYLLRKMSFMLISSIVMIGLILLFFLLTIRTVWRQELMAERNVNLFNNMAHEFQTPLTNIRLAVRMLEKQAKSNPQTQRFLEIIKQENQKLSNEVKQVLTVSRMSESTILLKKDLLDLHELTLTVLSRLELQIQENEANITLQLHAHQAALWADYEQLSKVMINLIDNAMKYSDGPAEVLIETEANEKGIYWSIIDHGIGIRSIEKTQIFDRFYRVSQGDTHQIKGFGLGLSFVKMVVEAHQGYINVNSKPGIGTCFQIFIPFEPQPSSHA